MDSASGRIELSFTEIRVADWPGAVRWYAAVLGLRPVVEDAESQFALLEAGVSRLALKGGAEARQEGSTPNVRFVFQVGNVDVERDRLIGLGVDVGPAMDNPTEAYRAATCVACDGTPITLFSWLDPSGPPGA
jgi:predicted enzyme related to lactoylglutathione lyase